jgi:hypothetical protein
MTMKTIGDDVARDAIQIRYLGDMARLEIKPGDRFVLQANRPLSLEQHQYIKKLWAGAVGEGVPLLIIDGGLKLGVISTAFTYEGGDVAQV